MPRVEFRSKQESPFVVQANCSTESSNAQFIQMWIVYFYFVFLQIPHASIEATGSAFSDSVTYTCDEGYKRTGAETITCQADQVNQAVWLCWESCI